MADIPHFPDVPEGSPVSNFVHLHVHSDYSLLDGASKITTLIARAKQLNMKALALTDHGNMFGVLNFEHICHANGINPVIGEEFYVAYGSHTEHNDVPFGLNGKHSHYFHLILLCRNVQGYKNMSWLSSLAFQEGLYYGKPRIDFELLKKYHEGIICLSACIQGEIPQLLLNGRDEEAEKTAHAYQELFGKDCYYIEVQNHGLPEQESVAPKLIALAHRLGIPLVLTNDVHYCRKEDAKAQEVLSCIGYKKLLTEPHQTMGNGRTEWYLKTEQEMASLFPGYPEMMANTVQVASMCDVTIPQFSTQELKSCLPVFKIPSQFPGQDYYVLHLVETGLRRRYKIITPEIISRAIYELGIIFRMGFSGYFLVVWEFINWAKENHKPIGPGRGSGAGSLVAYAMTITDIDPFRFKLIFERFLNPERVSMPDFDVDMDYDFRQDIIEHTRQLYGNEKVGHIVTFGSLKAKAVIADVGRVLGIPLKDVNILKSCIPEKDVKFSLADAFALPTEKHPDGGRLIPYKDRPEYKELFELCFKLENINRNTGLHASGMVIALSPLPDWAPVCKDPKTGEVAVQYTMDIIEPCGLVKMDYLGLKTLSLIRYTEDIINRHRREGEQEFHCDEVSETDSTTFDLFCHGDTVAVFQFESPGMQKILKQAQPRRLEEIVALNALYRPGPMDYIPKYIEGKLHPETVTYPDPCLQDILAETYGVMVYQEQVMQVAQKIAGFSLGGADMLRRAMGKKKIEVLMSKKKEFEEGAVKQGFTKEHADEIFDIMVPFAGYGFNKSHAAAYTVVAYRTAWLKAHKPAEFMAANLTNEITSTDKLPIYIEESRRMGIPVDAPDINRSDVLFDVVDGHIVFGLKGIKGMGDAAAHEIADTRKKGGLYKSFMDFLERISTQTVNQRAIEALIKTGAFDAFGVNRPTLLQNLQKAAAWAEAKKAESAYGQNDLFGSAGEKSFPDFVFEKAEDLPRLEKLNQEKELIGSYISSHPLDDYRKAIKNSVTLTSLDFARAAKEAEALEQTEQSAKTGGYRNRDTGKAYTVLGMLTALHVIRTKSGKDMAFGKLQDYHGTIDITFFPYIWQELGSRLHADGIYAFTGRISCGKGEPSFCVEHMKVPESLEAHAAREVHIELENTFTSEQDIGALKEYLFGQNGSCTVFFHIDTDQGPYIVRANEQMTVSAGEETMEKLKGMPFVKEVWAE